jgi:hypothetical protein
MLNESQRRFEPREDLLGRLLVLKGTDPQAVNISAF